MASTKLPNTGFSIFSEMTEKAIEHKALNLSQGFPEFDCSDQLKERVAYYMGKGFNQYAPLQGVLPLRENISQMISDSHNYYYDPASEITITAGATQAIFTAITAFVREDDEVIIIEPAFDTYEPAIRLNGGRPVFVQLNSVDYSINWDEVQRIVNSRTKMIIINTPQNPSGMTFSEEDMLRLQKIVNGSKMIVMSDEVYEHIIFDGGTHNSVARYPELAKRSLLISSFGKTYNTTGWKVGYCCAPSELTHEFRKIHQLIVYAANTPIQHAYADMIADKDSWQNLKHFYQQKRDTFVDLITESRFTIIPSTGTFFQLLKYSNISDKNDIEFTDYLVKEVGIAAIPLSVFYHEKIDNKVLRFCFAKNDDTLEKAARLLNKL
jgi:methionine aminotransferase